MNHVRHATQTIDTLKQQINTDLHPFKSIHDQIHLDDQRQQEQLMDRQRLCTKVLEKTQKLEKTNQQALHSEGSSKRFFKT